MSMPCSFSGSMVTFGRFDVRGQRSIDSQDFESSQASCVTLEFTLAALPLALRTMNLTVTFSPSVYRVTVLRFLKVISRLPGAVETQNLLNVSEIFELLL